ncbi:TIR domain-containing protein [Amycolatopsis lexingtonensis]|uniref:TIR domain-containing protein n=1 Tax=Amycolatopsis lexingtonensis TaxID=218822 RepID=UPI003F71A239
MAKIDHEYDLAVSFSGQDRNYVERVVRACQAQGLTVFYDQDETVRLWGRNGISEFRRIYGGVAARFVVPFFSRAYLAGGYPMDELTAATVADVERGGGYILPVMLDSVKVPREMLSPDVIYISAADKTQEQLVGLIVEKVAQARREHQEPRDVIGVVTGAVKGRLPRLKPTSFNPVSTLGDALTRVGILFEQNSGQLEQFGLTCSVRRRDESVDVQVAESGRPVCELRLQHGNDLLSQGKLILSFAWPRITGGGANGFVAAKWDAEAMQAKLELDDFSLGGFGRERPGLLTADELFEALWNKVVDFLERRV